MAEPDNPASCPVCGANASDGRPVMLERGTSKRRPATVCAGCGVVFVRQAGQGSR